MSKTLVITFTPVTPAPQAGYRVRYWPTNSPLNVTTIAPNPTGSPVAIPGLTETSYSGTIEVSCGGGTFSSPTSFTGVLAGGSPP